MTDRLTSNIEEDLIFDEYTKRYGPLRLIRDGAIAGGNTSYFAEPFKVLVVLKEGNDPLQEWTLSDIRSQGEGTCHTSRSTWPRLSQWIALALSEKFDLPLGDALALSKDHELRLAVLRRTAVVNLKKFGGGGTAEHPAIEREAVKHSDLLKKQLSLYKPDVTLAGGDFVAETLAKLYSKQTWRSPIQRDLQCFRCDELGLVLASWHPATRESAATIYDFLRDNLRYYFSEK